MAFFIFGPSYCGISLGVCHTLRASWEPLCPQGSHSRSCLWVQFSLFFSSNNVMVLGISEDNHCSVCWRDWRQSQQWLLVFTVIIPRALLALALGIWTALLVSAAIISVGILVKGRSAVTLGKKKLTVTVSPPETPSQAWAFGRVEESPDFPLRNTLVKEL